MKTLGVLGFMSMGGIESAIIFILVVGGFVYLNVRIAKWKGYPFWTGIIASIFIIFGTIFLLLLPFSKGKNK